MKHFIESNCIRNIHIKKACTHLLFGDVYILLIKLLQIIRGSCTNSLEPQGSFLLLHRMRSGCQNQPWSSRLPLCSGTEHHQTGWPRNLISRPCAWHHVYPFLKQQQCLEGLLPVMSIHIVIPFCLLTFLTCSEQRCCIKPSYYGQSCVLLCW